MSRPAKITVDLTAIQYNYQLAQALAQLSAPSLAKSPKTLAVVKADAYGHGSVEVAKALTAQVEMFAVSCLEEAIHLRNAGVQNKILLLAGFFEVADIDLGIQQNCEFVLHNHVQIQTLLDTSLDNPITVWLKIDTGMHRLGVSIDTVQEVFAQLSASKNIENIRLLSHFSNADDLTSDYTAAQVADFNACVSSLIQQQAKAKHCELSLANSAGVLAWPDSRLDWNRPGIMLYGLTPFITSHPEADKLIPAMTFTSQIIALRNVLIGESVGYGNTWIAQRDSVIATIAVGYGDGYPRTAKSGTPVLVNGQRVSLVGRVSMDLICVDVTDLAEVEIGAPVELWGKHLSANEVAKWADTIGYELVTRMPNRAKKEFIKCK
ncbi:alanine racemase [Paraglaciecola aquimarina]|uniref:Alanine racemase n=1 Tax=Paraglaciecola algarum TaxID=3050085 RepID=A0ABS9D327_9ALTE|nr:alanine racemase [Paraglaciecola sp. G1-23]MCF2946862.1 alanine racemase [Paraglaciecola sp. G1-23]